MENTALTWLLQQAPVIAVMGIIIWWLAARFTKKDNELQELSKEVMKLVALWEAKADALASERTKFADLLNRLLDQHREKHDDLLSKLKELADALNAVLQNQQNSENAELKAIKNQLDELLKNSR